MIIRAKALDVEMDEDGVVYINFGNIQQYPHVTKIETDNIKISFKDDSCLMWNKESRKWCLERDNLSLKLFDDSLFVIEEEAHNGCRYNFQVDDR